jgi:hypothetical protein
MIPGWRAILRWSHGYAKELELPSNLPCQVLLVRRTGDEAISILGAAQVLSQIFTRLLRIFTLGIPFESKPPQTARPYLRIDWPMRAAGSSERVGALLMISAAALLGFLYVGGRMDIFKISQMSVRMSLLLGVATLLSGCVAMGLRAWLLVILTPLVSLICFFLIVLATFFFGFRFSLAAIGMHISADSRPWVRLTH